MTSQRINSGGSTVHAKRMPGRFRTIKYITQSSWLFFFAGAYLRWDGRQAMVFDVPNRQFRLFGLTMLPQDIWMVALLLLLLAMILFAVTAVASRIFCGYFCFQTSWTDLFVWIEEKTEGHPHKRRKLDAAPWNAEKIRSKLTKHGIWLLVSVLTGISFSIWFTDAFEYWHNLLAFNLPPVAWVTLAVITLGTYFLAGFMREQVCFWLCPYARIQGGLCDLQTLLPAYDEKRGEPRARLRRKEIDASAGQGDCVDCRLCVHVCPTGIDIRDGQQLGCITCGLCIDACDSVMDKIGRPRGLIRYASLDEMAGEPARMLYQRPRTLVYVAILAAALAGIIYGLTHLGALTLGVVPERQPLFVRMSDGSIQNRYAFNVVNKTGKDLYVTVRSKGGVKGQVMFGAEQPQRVLHGRPNRFTIFVRAPEEYIGQEITPIEFYVENTEDPNMKAEYPTQFNGPKR